MESNDDGTNFVGRRMSIAIQRAKESENQTPDELVMTKTVNGVDAEISGKLSG